VHPRTLEMLLSEPETKCVRCSSTEVIKIGEIRHLYGGFGVWIKRKCTYCGKIFTIDEETE